MRILFAGSPAVAVPALLKISEYHQIAGILTNPDSAQGRGREMLPTPVALAAKKRFGDSVPVFTPEKLSAEVRLEIARTEPEILVAFAYGKIFGPRFLSLFPKGGINIHPSLLPRHRGSSPIQQAILDRDAETGVSIQKIALEMDSGDIFCVERIPLSGRETAASLTALCAETGARLAAKVLDEIERGEDVAVPQRGVPTYCRKIAKEDGLIDWDLSCLDIDARIRAFDPWPGSYAFLKGQRLNILDSHPYPTEDSGRAGFGAADALPKPPPGTIIGVDKSKGIMVQTGDGLLALRTLQFSTRKALPYKDFANGIKNLAGLRLERQP